MTDRYAVVGNPIQHSRSPRIHQLFAEQTGQDMSYDAILIEPGNFRRDVEAFFQQGGKGLNVTLPFKTEAWEFAGRLSPQAREAGAVNTLSLEADGLVSGHNTDGVGLVRDLTQRLNLKLEGIRILVLGAGGAVRGVLGPLLAQQPEQMVVCNRTRSRAEQLARAFSRQGAISAQPLEQLQGCYDLVINGTSASLQGQVIELPGNLLGKNSLAYDMVYSSNPTPFMQWAESQDAATSDGLGMLVAQAAESFRLWRGESPNFVNVVETLRAEMVN